MKGECHRRMNYTNGILPIRNYPEYDSTGVRVLYLIPEKEISANNYTAVKTYLGTNGPGWQVLNFGSKYYLHSDCNPDEMEKVIAAEVTEAGGTYTLPEASTTGK